MITPEQIEKLREAARAATQGPWSDSRVSTVDTVEGFLICDCIDCADADENAAYISQVSPDVILALLEERERYREALRFYSDARNYHFCPCGKCSPDENHACQNCGAEGCAIQCDIGSRADEALAGEKE